MTDDQMARAYGWRRVAPGKYESTHLWVQQGGRGWWVVFRKDNERVVGREAHLRRAKHSALIIEHLKALQDKRDEANNV